MNAQCYDAIGALQSRNEPDPVLVAGDVLPLDTAAEAMPGAGVKPVLVG